MIKSNKPVTLSEVKELLKDKDTDKSKSVSDFIKKFVKLKPTDAAKLKEELNNLGIIKLKDREMVKLIDFMPEDAEDVRKIFSGSDVSLDQDEIDKILKVFNK